MKNSRLSQLILTVLLILSCTHKGFAADANPFFVPPPRLKSDVNLDGYQFNLPSKVDKAWIESLRQYISRHFDAGVVLDVGSWSRPHPIYRPRENGSPDAFTLGHGVTIVAVTTAIAYSIRRSVYYMDLFTELRKVKSFKIAADNLYAMMRQKAEQNVIVVRHDGANGWSSSMVKHFLTLLKTRSCANLLHFPLN